MAEERIEQELLDEVMMQTALMLVQGVPHKIIQEKIGISNKTLWTWRQKPAFKEVMRNFQQIAFDTAKGVLMTLGELSARKLGQYLIDADPDDPNFHKVAITILKMQHSMGLELSKDEVGIDPIKSRQRLTDDLLNEVFGVTSSKAIAP